MSVLTLQRFTIHTSDHTNFKMMHIYSCSFFTHAHTHSSKIIWTKSTSL